MSEIAPVAENWSKSAPCSWHTSVLLPIFASDQKIDQELVRSGVVLIWCGGTLPHSQQKQIAAVKKAG